MSAEFRCRPLDGAVEGGDGISVLIASCLIAAKLS